MRCKDMNNLVFSKNDAAILFFFCKCEHKLRITSYNVCYTKLLRPELTHRSVYGFKPQITWCKVKFLVISRVVRDVHFTVFTSYSYNFV